MKTRNELVIYNGLIYNGENKKRNYSSKYSNSKTKRIERVWKKTQPKQ